MSEPYAETSNQSSFGHFLRSQILLRLHVISINGLNSERKSLIRVSPALYFKSETAASGVSSSLPADS